jgi:hypothetical protein
VGVGSGIGGGANGVTDTPADGTDIPTAFVAVTVIVYVTPIVKPDTVHANDPLKGAARVQEAPPGDAVAA